MPTDTTLFHKEKHISYWLRCLRSPLPHQYTSNDPLRMTLGFFTLSALDLLGVLFTRTTTGERSDFASWIYRCQHSHGGFRGFPGTDLGARANEKNAVWDPASLPATYFALASLCVLGDDLGRLDRRACLAFLKRMQRPDGSFGEMLGEGGAVEGGLDTRFGYCAMGIRWILRGDAEGLVEDVEDVDIEKFVECVRMSETYDGGISEAPYHEAHAGFTYCAIAALSVLGRLPTPETTLHPYTSGHTERHTSQLGLSSYDATLTWLVSRLTTTIENEGNEEEEDDYEEGLEDYNDGFYTPPIPAEDSSTTSRTHPVSNSIFTVPSMSGEAAAHIASESIPIFDPPDAEWTGYNGRPNKIADTCYAFWVGASLHILKADHLIQPVPIRRYLLAKTQHPVAGGFGKSPNDPPDLYHAYLGLAALALLEVGEEHEKATAGAGGREDGGAEIAILGNGTEDDQGGGNEDGWERSGMWFDDLEERMRGGVGKGKVPGEGAGVDESATTVSEEPPSDHEPGRTLRRLDPTLCFSKRAKDWVEGLSWRRALRGKE